MGNLGAHVKSVHHLPFSKKLYQESLRASQAAEQQNNTDAAGQPQPSGAGTLPLPGGPSLALQAPLPTGGTVLGTGSSLQPLSGTSPANAPIVLYDKKTLLEHYQKIKASQAAEQQNNTDAARQPQPSGAGTLHLPDGPSLALQAPLPTGGTVLGTGSSLQPLPGTSPPANAPIVLYDKKTLLEHYQKKVYKESAPSSNLAAATNVNSNTTSNPENNQDMNGPSSGVQSSQLLVTGGPVTNQGNNTQEIRASAPPCSSCAPSIFYNWWHTDSNCSSQYGAQHARSRSLSRYVRRSTSTAHDDTSAGPKLCDCSGQSASTIVSATNGAFTRKSHVRSCSSIVYLS